MAGPLMMNSEMYHKIVAERVYFHFAEQLSEMYLNELSSTIQVDAIASAMSHSFVVQLRGWMAGRKMPISTELGYVDYPAGVWQMFKDKFLPAWFKARFPVRKTRVSYVKTTNEYSLCPHIAGDSRNSGHLEFMLRRP